MRLRGCRPQYLARPGCPDRYSRHQAAGLLGISTITLNRWMKSKKIRNFYQTADGKYWIPRSEIIRLARIGFADTKLKLARVISASQPKGRLIAVTHDAKVRGWIARHQPLYASSLFALGQMLSVEAAWCVLIDWETVGSDWARDFVQRLGAVPDRPYLVGILPADMEEKSSRWDSLVGRSSTAIIEAINR